MTAKAVLVALIGTAFLVFVFPYLLATFSMAPNGTEILLLVVALGTVCWVVSRISNRARRLSR